MTGTLDWWNQKNNKYSSEEWIDKPTIFAQWAVKYFPKEGKILDLGAGHGQDSRYFANNGYQVTSTDFSDTALKLNKEKLPHDLTNKVLIQKVDLSQPFPYEDSSFDIVYAHLSLHFFNDITTDKIISEIHRVLRPTGIVAILVNSTNDPEYNTGKMLDRDYFELSQGDVKHFFSQEYLKAKTSQFETIILDNQGTTLKDSAKGVFGLIRYLGRKKA
jgi:ubiquinone/menaquinone biosynthesis C-methylase UbiE